MLFNAVLHVPNHSRRPVTTATMTLVRRRLAGSDAGLESDDLAIVRRKRRSLRKKNGPRASTKVSRTRTTRSSRASTRTSLVTRKTSIDNDGASDYKMEEDTDSQDELEGEEDQDDDEHRFVRLHTDFSSRNSETHPCALSVVREMPSSSRRRPHTEISPVKTSQANSGRQTQRLGISITLRISRWLRTKYASGGRIG
jgi:hypothetical protein